MSNNGKSDMNDPQPPLPKKVYETPVLIEYGDILALTHAVGQHGNPDGGHITGVMSSQP